MHTYIKHREDYYTVGFAASDFKKEVDRIIGWYPLKDYKNESEAIAMVCRLNGGDGG